MRKLRRNPLGANPRRREHFSPFMLVGVLVSVTVVLVGAVIFLLPHLESHAAAVNMNCTLLVPANPLTAQGLATPYQLSATDPANGPCNEANPNQSAFVQGVIYDSNAGTLSVYNPLVIDQGTQPAIQPTVPTLPAGAVVGIWFGFNGNNLLLQSAQGGTLAQANCVNGLGQSLFTQFAYCNAPAFFAAVNQGITAGKVQIPALGTAKDGQPCPTTRDFSVVDQDQSDNVQSQYLATVNGQTAQFSAANQAQLQNTTIISNPSDNRLLTSFIDPALGCQAWQAPNLADNGTPVAALALDELQAAAFQQPPIALVPLTDPMTMVANGNNNHLSRAKTDLYRLGVDQMPVVNNQQTNGTTYCQNLVQTGMPRLQLDQPLTVNAPSPDAAAANNLFTFLAQRFQASYNNLNCPQLLNMPNPVTTQTDGNGVVISATFNGQTAGMPTTPAPTMQCPRRHHHRQQCNANNANANANTNTNANANANANTNTNTNTNANTNTNTNANPAAPTTPTPGPTLPTTSAPNCTIDGQAINACTGTAMINNQACTLSFANNMVVLNCPAESQTQSQ